MKIFNARLDINSVERLTTESYKVTANVIDNTGNYFASNVELDDVIYVDGSSWGVGILRYKIGLIHPETAGATLVATINWDMKSLEAQDLYEGAAAVIGRKNSKVNTAALTNIFTNMASESLISDARNYQDELIGDAIEKKENSLGNPTQDGQVLASTVDGNREWITMPSITDAIESLKGQPNGLAPLDENGFIPVGNIPAIAITDVYVVNSEAEMLASGAIGAEKGDLIVREDLGEQFILHGNDASLLANWTKLSQPVPVSSVNGKIGVVILTTSDISEGSNLYYTDERVANSPAVKSLETAMAEIPGGDMEKSVYDTNNDGIVDRAAVADSVEYVNIQGKPTFSNVATTGDYNDLINKPAIPTKTSDLLLDNVYTKAESDTLLDTKANSIDVYTKLESYNKTEVDTLLDSKVDTVSIYTKPEIDILLDTKANSTDVYTKLESYNKTEVDTLLDDKANVDSVYTKLESDVLFDEKANAIDVYTKLESDALLDTKADANNVYTKLESDTLLDTKANSVDVYNKTESDALLNTKSNASETYTKTEIESLLGGAVKVLRYGNSDATFLATGEGVTITKAGNNATINCPVGVKIINAMIHFTAAEIGATGNCVIDFGSSGSYDDGTGMNTDYTNIIPPMYQVINDVNASRAYKVSPPPAANLNTSPQTLQLTGLISNVGIWVRLVF